MNDVEAAVHLMSTAKVALQSSRLHGRQKISSSSFDQVQQTEGRLRELVVIAICLIKVKLFHPVDW